MTKRLHSVVESPGTSPYLTLIIPYPKRSMYAIYGYIDPPNHPNVGIYGIHGESGYVY